MGSCGLFANGFAGDRPADQQQEHDRGESDRKREGCHRANVRGVLAPSAYPALGYPVRILLADMRTPTPAATR